MANGRENVKVSIVSINLGQVDKDGENGGKRPGEEIMHPHFLHVWASAMPLFLILGISAFFCAPKYLPHFFLFSVYLTQTIPPLPGSCTHFCPSLGPDLNNWALAYFFRSLRTCPF